MWSVPDVNHVSGTDRKLPDQEMRIRMVKFMEAIPGFDKLQEMPAYPGKAYNGYIRRAMNARAALAK